MKAKLAANTRNLPVNIDELAAGIDRKGNEYFLGTIHINGKPHTGQFSATDFEEQGILLEAIKEDVDEMKILIVKNDWLSRKHGSDHGWGNGYVIIPKGHKLYGMGYDKLNEHESINVNGRLTFSQPVDEKMVKKFNLNKGDIGKWCVGFDTLHAWDTLEKWPKSEVEKEALKLKEQLEEVSKSYSLS